MEELMFTIRKPSGEHALMKAWNVNGCIGSPIVENIFLNHLESLATETFKMKEKFKALGWGIPNFSTWQSYKKNNPIHEHL
jgi:hypothetical protein